MHVTKVLHQALDLCFFIVQNIAFTCIFISNIQNISTKTVYVQIYFPSNTDKGLLLVINNTTQLYSGIFIWLTYAKPTGIGVSIALA